MNPSSLTFLNTPLTTASTTTTLVSNNAASVAYNPHHQSSHSNSHSGSAHSSGYARLIGSGTAGFLELIIFHPVDTIAKRLMTNKENYRSPIPGQTIKNLNTIIFKSAADSSIGGKFLSLFPGLGFAAGYKISQRIYKFGGQPVVNDYIKKNYSELYQSQFGTKWSKVLIGGTAGAIIGVGEVLLLPLDILKIKAQTNPGALAGNNILKLIATERFHLYGGAGWTALRNAPGSFALFGGAGLVYYHFFKLQDQKQATFKQMLVGSVVGSISSIAISSPFDVIKTRIQKESAATKVSGGTVFRQLIRHEGVGALFKGLTPKILIVGPKLIFSFTIAQWLVNKLEKAF